MKRDFPFGAPELSEAEKAERKSYSGMTTEEMKKAKPPSDVYDPFKTKAEEARKADVKEKATKLYKSRSKTAQKEARKRVGREEAEKVITAKKVAVEKARKAEIRAGKVGHSYTAKVKGAPLKMKVTKKEGGFVTVSYRLHGKPKTKKISIKEWNAKIKRGAYKPG